MSSLIHVARDSGRALALMFVGMLALGIGIGGSLGLSGAFAGLDDANTIHACIHKRTQRIRIVDSASACRSWETPIEWQRATDVADLELRLSALEAQVPDCLTTSGSDAVFSGCNVYVQNGEESTDIANGAGNLIIGYNETSEAGEDRAGSHNLVVGAEHSYASYGGLVVGLNNTISGPYSSVSGGTSNTASGARASVSGGEGNIASGEASSISGGDDNLAGGLWSSVSGGESNVASGAGSTVSAGIGNQATGAYASVSAGESNIASGDFSTVSGGSNREADGQSDWRAGSLIEDF